VGQPGSVQRVPHLHGLDAETGRHDLVSTTISARPEAASIPRRRFPPPGPTRSSWIRRAPIPAA
jgi:hypothetical protein